MIQVHGKTILSMKFNPILKAHGSSPWQLLIKAHGKSCGNYLYFTNIQVIIRGLHSRSRELCKKTFLLHLESCQHFATLLFSLFPLLHGESLLEKCSHKEIRITLAALHKQKSYTSRIHPAIPWHYSKLPTAVSSQHTIYLVVAKV